MKKNNLDNLLEEIDNLLEIQKRAKWERFEELVSHPTQAHIKIWVCDNVDNDCTCYQCTQTIRYLESNEFSSYNLDDYCEFCRKKDCCCAEDHRKWLLFLMSRPTILMTNYYIPPIISLK